MCNISEVPGLPCNVFKISCGSIHSFAVCMSQVFCEIVSQTDILYSDMCLTHPFLTAFRTNISSFPSSSPFFCCWLVQKTRDGRVFAWGMGDQGQLGDGGDENPGEPIEIESLAPGPPKSLHVAEVSYMKLQSRSLLTQSRSYLTYRRSLFGVLHAFHTSATTRASSPILGILA
jgi:hypothetical protein